MASPQDRPSGGLTGGTHSWGEAAAAFLHPKVIALLFLGFSAGLPILLIFSTLSVWLREAEVQRATIGFFSWAALGYGFKFVWAPVIDKLPVPVLSRMLGHRRSWLLVSQGSIIVALVLMAMTDPLVNLQGMAIFAIMLGFSSATQDIIIDAYRIECADKDLQGLLSASYIAGYRIGMIVAGAGALELAGLLDDSEGYNFGAWSTTYLAMALVMLVGVATTFVISERSDIDRSSRYLRSTSDYARFVLVFAVAALAFAGCFFLTGDVAQNTKAMLAADGGMTKAVASLLVEAIRLAVAVAAAVVVGWIMILAGVAHRTLVVETYVDPFADFFARFGKVALLILALVALYRIADVVMGVMANVFYIDLGFEKQTIGRISKFFGLIMTILGGFAGGLLMVRYGVMRMLFAGALLAAATNILFAVLATVGADIRLLVGVIAADNLSAGIASAAFVAYLSSLTSLSFTATQFALFTSIMNLVPKLIAGYSGMVVDAVGYPPFFIGTAALGIPVLILIWLATRLAPPELHGGGARGSQAEPAPAR